MDSAPLGFVVYAEQRARGEQGHRLRYLRRLLRLMRDPRPARAKEPARLPELPVRIVVPARQSEAPLDDGKADSE
jgi:hypothetical protein